MSELRPVKRLADEELMDRLRTGSLKLRASLFSLEKQITRSNKAIARMRAVLEGHGDVTLEDIL